MPARKAEVHHAQEEGIEFVLLTNPTGFIDDGNGNVSGLTTVSVNWKSVDGRMQMTEIPGSEQTWEADLVFLAMGFLSPESYLAESLGIELDDRQNYLAEHGDFL